MTIKESRLAKARREHNLTQDQLAVLMSEGRNRPMSRINVAQVELGIRQPWKRFKRQAAEVLGLSESELFGE